MKPARCGGGRIPPLLLKIGLIRFHSYALKPSVQFVGEYRFCLFGALLDCLVHLRQVHPLEIVSVKSVVKKSSSSNPINPLNPLLKKWQQ